VKRDPGAPSELSAKNLVCAYQRQPPKRRLWEQQALSHVRTIASSSNKGAWVTGCACVGDDLQCLATISADRTMRHEVLPFGTSLHSILGIVHLRNCKARPAGVVL